MDHWFCVRIDAERVGNLLFYRFQHVRAVARLPLALQRLLWRLRHRLIVTYIFIGVIPIVLLLTMAGIAGFLFAGQFDTYIVTSTLQSELRHLAAVNDTGALAANSDQSFPQRTVTVWRGEKGHPDPVPAAIKGNFSGFVLDGDSLHLRAVKRDGQVTVISDVPVTPELLRSATSLLGSVTVLLPDRGGDVQVPPPANPNPNFRPRVEAGSLPPSSSRFDRNLPFYTLFDAVDWATGKSQTCAIGVNTRPSRLYATLFATLGDEVKGVQYLLAGVAIFFGLIEMVALFISIRLSRSITLSVANLYTATEHVSHGDFTHRIRVRNRDQMATQEQSFNSMAESLVQLLAEQKEKQRLENELAIAYQVQDLLFPHKFAGLASLEVYGVCRPARSVSGDYYDFVPLGAERLVLAVGDISGKGISAALLMATVHAFVRAYSLEPGMVPAPEAGAFSGGNPSMYYRGDGLTQSRLAPGMLMTTLNYQLFHGTPVEKYATMFLACYDATMRELKYCNAGHLPPVLLSGDARVSCLETSGTVAGLFEEATYDESAITMQAGDILIAFTDGVTEPEKESQEFGEERLIAIVEQHRDQPLSRSGAAITRAVADWIGDAEQPDDVTVVLARAR
jgi:sigma-B regulation protein RsbU (phosphoserine phosphatase)